VGYLLPTLYLVYLHGSLNLLWIATWVIELKSDHLGPQSTVDYQLGAPTKNVTI